MSSLDQTTSAIKRLDARSDQSSFLQTTYAAPKPSERLPPPSGSGKAQKVPSEKIVQFQNGTDFRKSKAHKRMRSASNRAGASSPQSVVSPSPTAPLSAPLSLAVGVTSLASPTTHDVPADNEVEEDEELVTARPRKRGVAQKLDAKTKRKRAITEADNYFVLQRIKTVATTESSAIEQASTGKPTIGKRKETVRAKANPRPRSETPISALDCPQKSQEARFRKQKNINKLAEAVKK
jgi:hypothetical protein